MSAKPDDVARRLARQLRSGTIDDRERYYRDGAERARAAIVDFEEAAVARAVAYGDAQLAAAARWAGGLDSFSRADLCKLVNQGRAVKGGVRMLEDDPALVAAYESKSLRAIALALALRPGHLTIAEVASHALPDHDGEALIRIRVAETAARGLYAKGADGAADVDVAGGEDDGAADEHGPLVQSPDIAHDRLMARVRKAFEDDRGAAPVDVASSAGSSSRPRPEDPVETGQLYIRIVAILLRQLRRLLHRFGELYEPDWARAARAWLDAVGFAGTDGDALDTVITVIYVGVTCAVDAEERLASDLEDGKWRRFVRFTQCAEALAVADAADASLPADERLPGPLEWRTFAVHEAEVPVGEYRLRREFEGVEEVLCDLAGPLSLNSAQGGAYEHWAPPKYETELAGRRHDALRNRVQEAYARQQAAATR